MSGLATNREEINSRSHVVHNANNGVAMTTPGSNFVRVIDRKARSYLKTLERSFSSSHVERCEDPSFMTIEFLQTRLQAQRADYKLEKQRSQQLAKKVLELEERLKWEVELRKKMTISMNENMVPAWETQDVSYLNETSDMNDGEESSQEGLSLISSQPKEHVAKDEDRYCDLCSEFSCSSIPNDSVDGGHTTSPCYQCDNQNVASDFHLTGLQTYRDDERLGNSVDMIKDLTTKCEEYTKKVQNMETRMEFYPDQQSSIIPKSFDAYNTSCFLHNEGLHPAHNSILAAREDNDAHYDLNSSSLSATDSSMHDGNSLSDIQSPLRKTFSDGYSGSINYPFILEAHRHGNLCAENDAELKRIIASESLSSPDSYSRYWPSHFEGMRAPNKSHNETKSQPPSDAENPHHIFLPLYETFVSKPDNSNAPEMQLKHHMKRLDDRRMSLDGGLNRSPE